MKALKIIGWILVFTFVIVWTYFYESNCVFAGKTLVNTPSWCIALR